MIRADDVNVSVVIFIIISWYPENVEFQTKNHVLPCRQILRCSMINCNSSCNVIGKQKHEMVNNLYIDIDCLNNLLSQYLYRLRDTHRFTRLCTKLNGQYNINKLVFKNNVFFQIQFFTCHPNNNEF